MMMALNEGMFLSADGTFPVLWIRSVDYVLATPLLLLDLGLLAGAQSDEIFLMVTCDVVMIATGYWCVWPACVSSCSAAAQACAPGAAPAQHTRTHAPLTLPGAPPPSPTPCRAGVAKSTAAKWCLFFASMTAFCPILYTLVVSMQSHKELTDNPKVARLFNFLVAWTVVLWNCFWVVWLLYEGYHLISLQTEVIVHCILDVLAKCVFGLILLVFHVKLEEAMSEAGSVLSGGSHVERQASMGSVRSASQGSLRRAFSRKSQQGGGSHGDGGESVSDPATSGQASGLPSGAHSQAAAAEEGGTLALRGAPAAEWAAAPAPEVLLPPAEALLALALAADAPSPRAAAAAAAATAAAAAAAAPAAPAPVPGLAPAPATPRAYSAQYDTYRAAASPPSKESAFLAAAARGDVAAVTAALRAAPALARAVDASSGRTAFLEAAAHGAQAAAEALLSAGANPHATCARGCSALMLAAGGAGAPMLAWLLAKGGALVEQLDSGHMTPLHHAVLGARVENVKLLLARGGDIHVKDAYGRSPLEVARLMASQASNQDGIAARRVLYVMDAAAAAEAAAGAGAGVGVGAGGAARASGAATATASKRRSAPAEDIYGAV